MKCSEARRTCIRHGVMFRVWEVESLSKAIRPVRSTTHVVCNNSPDVSPPRAVWENPLADVAVEYWAFKPMGGHVINGCVSGLSDAASTRDKARCTSSTPRSSRA